MSKTDEFQLPEMRPNQLKDFKHCFDTLTKLVAGNQETAIRIAVDIMVASENLIKNENAANEFEKCIESCRDTYITNCKLGPTEIQNQSAISVLSVSDVYSDDSEDQLETKQRKRPVCNVLKPRPLQLLDESLPDIEYGESDLEPPMSRRQKSEQTDSATA